MFNPGPSLLDDTRHSDPEIVDNSLQQVIRNSPDFSLDVFFQPVNSVWVVLIHFLFQVTPEEVVQRAQIRGVGRPWIVGPPRDQSVP